MALYYVKCRGRVDETYAVEADTPQDAMANWAEGELVVSEAWDVGPESVELIDTTEPL